MPDRFKIRPLEGTWVVRAGGAILAESDHALELDEGDLPPVIYFPNGDIAMAFLEATDTRATCIHKGEAHYYTIVAKSGPIKDAAWTYAEPKQAVGEISCYIAFDTERVAVEEL